MIILAALWTFIGLSIGNFGYQAVTHQIWSDAFERSFFQGFALVAMIFTIRLRKAVLK